MRAHLLIANASYTPEELATIRKAFDEAWGELAAEFGEFPQDIEAARQRLANVILGLANNGARDADQLKNAALALLIRSA